MRNLFLSLLSITLLLITSCSSGSDDDNIIDPVDPVDPPTNTVTYTANIKGLIDNNCIGCHASTPTNGASVSLTTYANVKNAVTNNNLIARVENGSMPKNETAFTATQVQIIKDWQTGGFTE